MRVMAIGVFLTLLPVTISGAYLSSESISGGNVMGCRTRYNSVCYSRPIFDRNAFHMVEKHGADSYRERNPSNAFFSSTSGSNENKEKGETESEGTIKNSVPNISTTQGDIDFTSFVDIDWVKMDPLHDISFDEYEELYLHGKAKGDSSKKSNPFCDDSYGSIMTEWDEFVPTLNHISLVGRVGNQPEARYFDKLLGAESRSKGDSNSNKPNVVVSMSLALPRYYSAWEREQYGIEFGQEATEWFKLEVWGILAEFALKNVKIGSRIGVVGSIDTDFYRDKQNDLLSSSPKVLVQDLDILESKMEADARSKNNDDSKDRAGSNSITNYRNNSEMSKYRQQNENERGSSFFTDDNEEDFHDPTKGANKSSGGFFDPI